MHGSYNQLFADAADKLKETVRKGLTFDAAQIRVVGLDDIRRNAGEHWPALADRVRANSMSFLEGCVAQGDIVIPCGDGFLVIYAHAEDRDLDSECAEIQEMLNAFYVGSEGMRALKSRVSGQRIPAREMAHLLDPPRAQAPLVREHEIVFLPAWSAAREAVGVYLGAPRTREHGVGYAPAYRETGQHDEDDYSVVDARLLEAVRAAIEASGRPSIVAYSVHATTLAHRERRRAFLAQLATIPERTRKFMLGRIAEVSPGTPVLTLADWVHQLRPFTPRVALELHPSERSINGLDGVGAWSVGCLLPTAVQTIDMTPRHIEMIRRWRAQAHRQGLKVSFVNLNSPILINVACDEGVDLIASDSVWPALPKPAGVKLFSTIRLRNALAQMGAPARRNGISPAAYLDQSPAP